MPASPLTRRALLAGGAATLAAGAVAGCAQHSHLSGQPPAGAQRHQYAAGKDHFGDLYLPSAKALGTVVVLHGGYWLPQYKLDLMVPICRALQKAGYAAWNLEYRRLEDGGGWPTTFTDVATGVDHLTRLEASDRLDLDRVVILGHSAGGQLAGWSASRTQETPGGAPRVEVKGVVSLSGVLNLTRGVRENLGGGVIPQLLGGDPEQVPDRYRLGDPTLLVPASAPVACVRGTSDNTVPRDQSTTYVAAATGAGAAASFTEVGGDHFTLIDPKHSSWRTTMRLVTSLAAG